MKIRLKRLLCLLLCIVYKIVKLDRGAFDKLYPNTAIIGKDDNDDGTTWGIEARAGVLEWDDNRDYADIAGHLADNNSFGYGYQLKYDDTNLYAVHDGLLEIKYSDDYERALWGFRDLYSNTSGINPPPDS